MCSTQVQVTISHKFLDVSKVDKYTMFNELKLCTEIEGIAKYITEKNCSVCIFIFDLKSFKKDKLMFTLPFVH